MTPEPKRLRWTEPPAVQRRYHPIRRSDQLSWPIGGGAILVGMVLMVLLGPRNSDPNAKWVVLGIGAVAAAFIGLAVPAINARSRTKCRVTESFIEVSLGFTGFRPYGIIHRSHVWDWYDVGSLAIQSEIIEGQTYNVLSILNRASEPIGFLGLSDDTCIEGLKQWAQARNRPIQIAASTADPALPAGP